MIDTLSAFPFLKDKTSDLKLELPLYLSQCFDVPESTDCLEWWKIHATQLPIWSSSVKLTLLVQPSSAAAELVFSYLNSSFKSQQDLSLQDYVEASLKL